MVRSQLLDAVCREIFVECGAAYFELVNDIADEWLVFDVLKHGFCVFNVLLIHGCWPATPASALCGGFETGAGVFNDQFTLELVEGCGHMEKQPAFWGRANA